MIPYSRNSYIHHLPILDDLIGSLMLIYLMYCMLLAPVKQSMSKG